MRLSTKLELALNRRKEMLWHLSRAYCKPSSRKMRIASMAIAIFGLAVAIKFFKKFG